MAKIICVDFDGVIHGYQSGWKGATSAYDPPVPGAVEWLMLLVDHGYEVCIYSSRSKEPGGIDCMREYLRRHGMGDRHLSDLRFPDQKPAASLTVDDRAFCFEGDFPSIAWIERFQPWTKR